MRIRSEILFIVIFKITSFLPHVNEAGVILSYAYLEANNCGYNRIQRDDLPHADAKSFKFPEYSIFFTETSCEGGLNFRQACSVESAARAHPHRQINVLFTVPVTKNRLKTRPLKGLLKYPNIKFFRILLQKYGRNTPLKTFMAHDLLLSTTFIHHAADVLRFLTLFKFGGIFLDLDTIVVKSFDELPQSRLNFVGKEDNETLSVSVVAFSNDYFGRILANATIAVFKHEFNPYQWISNGMEIFKTAVRHVFNRYNLRMYINNGNMLISSSSNRRLNLTIYNSNYFYPLPYTECNRMFHQGTLNLTNVYSIHFWNSITKYEFIFKGSIFEKIANQYCPETVKSYHFIHTKRKQAKKMVEKRIVSGGIMKLKSV